MGAEWRSSVHEPHVWPIVILGGGGMMRDGGCRSRNGSRGVLFRYCRGGAWQKIFDFPAVSIDECRFVPVSSPRCLFTGNFRNVISRNPRPAASFTE